MSLTKVKKCLKEPKQLLKLVVLLVCVCVTIYQLSDCVLKIMHPPIFTKYSFFLNESIKYPSLTICQKPPYKTKSFPKFGMINNPVLSRRTAFQNFPFDKYTIQQFLEETTYDFINNGMLAFAGNSEKTWEKETMFLLNYGQCTTIRPTILSTRFSEGGGYTLILPAPAGSSVIKDSYGRSSVGFDIYIHDSRDVLMDIDQAERSFMEYIYLEPSEQVFITLSLRMFSQIPQADESNCRPQPEYSRTRCLALCIYEQIYEKSECVLPWLPLLNQSNLPQCNDYESVYHLISGFNEWNITNFLKNCSCPISCNVSVYTPSILSRRDFTEGYSALNIYYSSNLITHTIEVVGYDWNAFLADIGGSLGFLLGLSVIGVILIIEEFLSLILFGDKKEEEEVKNDYDRGDFEQKLKHLEDFLSTEKVTKY